MCIRDSPNTARIAAAGASSKSFKSTQYALQDWAEVNNALCSIHSPFPHSPVLHFQSTPMHAHRARGVPAGCLTHPRGDPVLLAPSPRLNRELNPHNRGFPVGPAGNPLSPSPCSSLMQCAQTETGLDWLTDWLQHDQKGGCLAVHLSSSLGTCWYLLFLPAFVDTTEY